MNSETAPIAAPDAISDRDLVLRFESLGDNCEFGLVQRKAGAEPLGLLRFSSAPITALLRALRDRFEGLTDPAGVRLWSAKGEYLITMEKYGFTYHIDARVGEIDPDVLHQQQIRILPFLVKKFIADLESAEKILVFRQNETLTANELIDLRKAISDYGSATLLWVQQARPGHPSGSVDQIDDRLMIGYVERLADRETVPDLDLASWLGTLRLAYAVWRGMPAADTPEAAAPESIEIIFGVNGNALSHTRYGWSPAEDHHTFTIDDHSLLTIAPPANAPEYRLEMDIAPFLAPPALTSQRLEVIVNGALVGTFDLVEAGVAVCPVPGRLVHDQDRVDILLTHPGAMRPLDLGVDTDPRRLAVMFRRVTLRGMTEPAPKPRATIDDLLGLRDQPRSNADPMATDVVWALADRSLLILTRPPHAANYRLDIDMMPFVRPEAPTTKSLEVMINGTLAHTFFPLPPGPLSCAVPGRLVHLRDKAEILLIHPHAGELGGIEGQPVFRHVTLVASPE